MQDSNSRGHENTNQKFQAATKKDTIIHYYQGQNKTFTKFLKDQKEKFNT